MNADMRTLLISYSDELVDGQPIYVSSNCLPVKAPNLEPAGYSFHVAALKRSGFNPDENEEADDQSVSSDEKNQGFMPSSEYSCKGRKKTGSAGTQQDHYALLGLGHLRFLATEDQIRKSYRDAALKYHPDKQAAILLAEESEEARQAKKDEIETHFKLIQEAYEVLIDPVKRRIYDSTDEFDDEIPTDCAPQDFFKVFVPAFMRNGKWSVNQPVPSLGDENTPLNTVDSFYNFWYSFKSWREFPHADEFDIEQAESRDHKRWMERQNTKLREKARKDEYARVRILVDSAYKRDPRLLRRKEEEKAEKQRKKEARHLAKKMQEEEAQRIAEEEKRRKEEEERLAAEAASNLRKMKEKEKKLLRKEKNRLRSLSAPVVSGKFLDLSESDVESICTSVEYEHLKILCENMEQKVGIDRAKLLRDALNFDASKKTEDNPQQSEFPTSSLLSNGVMQPKPEQSQRKENPWGKDEIEMLRKAVQKYPKGTSRRWEVVSEYLGTGRSVEEILKATKTVLLQKPDSSKAFDSFLEKRKSAVPIASPLSTRLESTLPTEPVQTVVHPSASGQSSGSVHSQQKPESSEDPSPAPNGTVAGTLQDVWSTTQERALIQALKAFPKEAFAKDANLRWERVAAAVPGKTVNQCKKKFLLLKENFKSKKAAE